MEYSFFCCGLIYFKNKVNIHSSLSTPTIFPILKAELDCDETLTLREILIISTYSLLMTITRPRQSLASKTEIKIAVI